MRVREFTRLRALAAAIAVCSAAVSANLRASPVSPVKPDGFGWKLTQAKVICTGKTADLDEGTLTVGYEIESGAVALDPKCPIQRGVFRISATAFCPKEDMPGQKAGVWYIRGSWTICDTDIGAQGAKTRHNSAVLRGELLCDLTFNPSQAMGNVEAMVRMPMSRAGSIWRRGTAVFRGNEKFEGTIEGVAKRWPAARPTGGGA